MGLLEKLQTSNSDPFLFKKTPFRVFFLSIKSYSLAETIIIGIELFRLEQRYTRRKNRSGFVSDAQYVDGEYIYTTVANTQDKAYVRDQRDSAPDPGRKLSEGRRW